MNVFYYLVKRDKGLHEYFITVSQDDDYKDKMGEKLTK